MKQSNLDDSRLGFAAETAFTVYAYAEAEKNLWSIGYQDTKEIDVVIDKKNEILPIEVKYRNEAKITNSTKTRIVITKTEFKRENGVLFIPFWLVK